MKSLRIAVAGHVDHGKSTIIGRLLHETGSLAQHVTDKFDETQRSHGAHAATFAFVTDQLSEEQEGSFTLDTTQARLRTPNGDFTLIDTPGHREFLKNMISGTTRADAAILVVDAAEGPLPQTYLHAYLISMLGIRQMILVINKMDLVHYSRSRFMALSQQLSEHLGRLCIPPIAVVPVSAQQGDNVVRQSAHMIWNTSPTLIEAIEHLPPPERNGSQPLRFLVQCCFPVGGHTAVLGRVSSGNLRQGQPIVFGPLGHKTTVTAVRSGKQDLCDATTGQCVGLFLEEPDPVERGHMGFDEEDAPQIADRFTARAFWIGASPLDSAGNVQILCGTQCCDARVQRITRVVDPISLEAIQTGAPNLQDSQVAEIVIRTDSPMCIDAFDKVPESGRFAILSNKRIVGGGVIAE